MAPSVDKNDDLIAATRQSLDSLQVQRRALEQEGEAIIQELTTPPSETTPPAGIDTPLVDEEGYPRADIDLYRVRSQRKRLAEIRNDHKKLSQDMERYLQQLAAFQNDDKKEVEKEEYASRLAAKPKPKFDPKTGKWVVENWSGTIATEAGGEAESGSMDVDAAVSLPPDGGETATAATGTTSAPAGDALSTQAPRPVVLRRPFAKIDEVSGSDSPAALAGLEVGDLIVQFDAITIDDTDPFQQVARVVPSKAGQKESISITVVRGRDQNTDNNESVVTVDLTPRPWSGRGLVGCHIVPYSSFVPDPRLHDSSKD